jgi:hypothetical protein
MVFSRVGSDCYWQNFAQLGPGVGHAHKPDVHSTGALHGVPGGNCVAACAGVGATIEVTSGTAMIAPKPSVRTI